MRLLAVGKRILEPLEIMDLFLVSSDFHLFYTSANPITDLLNNFSVPLCLSLSHFTFESVDVISAA